MLHVAMIVQGQDAQDRKGDAIWDIMNTHTRR